MIFQIWLKDDNMYYKCYKCEEKVLKSDLICHRCECLLYSHEVYSEVLKTIEQNKKDKVDRAVGIGTLAILLISIISLYLWARYESIKQGFYSVFGNNFFINPQLFLLSLNLIVLTIVVFILLKINKNYKLQIKSISFIKKVLEDHEVKEKESKTTAVSVHGSGSITDSGTKISTKKLTGKIGKSGDISKIKNSKSQTSYTFYIWEPMIRDKWICAYCEAENSSENMACEICNEGRA